MILKKSMILMEADAPIFHSPCHLLLMLRLLTGALFSICVRQAGLLETILYLVICRDALLVEKCVISLHKDDLVCIEGRLVLTHSRIDGDLVPLAEILASNAILLQTTPKES